MEGETKVYYDNRMDQTRYEEVESFGINSVYVHYNDGTKMMIPGDCVKSWKIQGDCVHILDGVNVIHIVPINTVKHMALPQRKHCEIAAVEYVK